ncbi:HD domain-containing protein [Patescibacteria group bacterium]
MKYTDRLNNAIIKASKLHLGQKRKGDGLPYISHPIGVSFILSQYTKDEDIIIAGLMHDTLEDVKGYTRKELKADFGPKVLKIVDGVTEDKDPYYSHAKDIKTWRYRKEKYIADLNKDSKASLMVSCADKIHNLMSMLGAYENKGDKLWKKFNASKEDIHWFNQEILKVMKRRLGGGLTKEYNNVFTKAKIILLK